MSISGVMTYSTSQTVDLEIDESSFTGETTPSCKHTQPQSAAHNSISQLRNIAFMGTFVCSGHGKVSHQGGVHGGVGGVHGGVHGKVGGVHGGVGGVHGKVSHQGGVHGKVSHQGGVHGGVGGVHGGVGGVHGKVRH